MEHSKTQGIHKGCREHNKTHGTQRTQLNKRGIGNTENTKDTENTRDMGNTENMGNTAKHKEHNKTQGTQETQRNTNALKSRTLALQICCS